MKIYKFMTIFLIIQEHQDTVPKKKKFNKADEPTTYFTEFKRC